MRYFEYLHIKQDDIIYNQGDKSYYFYGIIEGSIVTYKKRMVKVEDLAFKPISQNISKVKLKGNFWIRII